MAKEAPNTNCTVCLSSPCICQPCQSPGCAEKNDFICELCNTCPLHCACNRCEGCHEIFKEVCKSCDNCTSCCKCAPCGLCGDMARTQDFCVNCKYCNHCCLCNIVNNSGLPLKQGTVKPYFWNPDGRGYSFGKKLEQTPDIKDHANTNKFQLNSTRYIAVEIEVAESDRRKAAPLLKALYQLHCSVVHDGSLPATGYEINTSPAYGMTFVNEILQLCTVLKDSGAKTSPACGIHVHVDARDLLWLPDFKNVLRTYYKVESALWGLLPVSRKASKYARPCGDMFYNALVSSPDLKSWKNNLFQLIYNSNTLSSEIRKSKRHDSRYNALNIHSWFHRGTLEFRHHHGSLNAEKIINWAMICCAIIDFSKKHSEEQLVATFGKLPALDILLLVIGDNPALRKWIVDRTKYFNTQREDDSEPFYE